ncbi:hypothetical protein B0O99DRAFT_674944 [Bisporella sp. PMI_857]|nr:hypothetical protein B0O99DRAFT_674944 [Bisporella sp. PMI_857]
MSEELVDGDLVKQHVRIYRELMGDIESGLSSRDSLGFVNSRHGLSESCVWKAAVAQPLISLFPHEFLPEMLGFNVHYEVLTWDTLRAIKEWKELKLNDYCFLLYVPIDIADSRHTTISYQTVVDYISYIQEKKVSLPPTEHGGGSKPASSYLRLFPYLHKPHCWNLTVTKWYCHYFIRFHSIGTTWQDRTATTECGENKWLRVVIYTGVTMCIGSLGLGGRFLKSSKNLGEVANQAS